MLQFHETVMGKRFFEVTLPKLTQAVGRLADAKEKEVLNTNDILEKLDEQNQILSRIADELQYLRR